MTNDDDGKLEFRVVFTGVSLDAIAVGTAKMEEIQFAEGENACGVKLRTDIERQIERAPYGTRWLDHHKGDVTSLLLHCICLQFRRALEFYTSVITSGCTDCPLRTLATLVAEVNYCFFPIDPRPASGKHRTAK